jgi:hypothetical protein
VSSNVDASDEDTFDVGQSRMNNPEKLAALGTHSEDKQNKQMLNISMHKNPQ